MKDYFNTVPESGDSLKDKRGKAKTQNNAVLKLYEVHVKLSPSQAWELLNMPDVPLTSIRRSISTLTDCGYLYKTTEKVVGRYGRNERVWELVEPF